MNHRQRWAVVAVGLLVGVLAWVGAALIGTFIHERGETDRRLRDITQEVRDLSQDVLDQSRLNQRHIDCLAAFLIRRNPDGCQGVRDQLVRDGILSSSDQGENP